MRCVRTLGLTTAWGGGALSPCEIPRDPESTEEEGEETGGGAPKSCEGRKGQKKKKKKVSKRCTSGKTPKPGPWKCFWPHLLRWDWLKVQRRALGLAGAAEGRGLLRRGVRYCQIFFSVCSWVAFPEIEKYKRTVSNNMQTLKRKSRKLRHLRPVSQNPKQTLQFKIQQLLNYCLSHGSSKASLTSLSGLINPWKSLHTGQ